MLTQMFLTVMFLVNRNILMLYKPRNFWLATAFEFFYSTAIAKMRLSRISQLTAENYYLATRLYKKSALIGQSPLSLHLPTSPPSTLSFCIFYFSFLHFLLALLIFLFFHPFSFYQNSPTPFPGRMS